MSRYSVIVNNFKKAKELGFDDIGFTSAEPFLEHKRYLEDHKDDYSWIEKWGFNLIACIDHKNHNNA